MKKLILMLFILIGLNSCSNRPNLISYEQTIIGIEKSDTYFCKYFFDTNYYILEECGKFQIGDTVLIQKKKYSHELSNRTNYNSCYIDSV